MKEKDEERKALQNNYEAQCNLLQTKIFKLQMEEKQKVVLKLYNNYFIQKILLTKAKK